FGSFFLSRSAAASYLPSFPTRRSSDLMPGLQAEVYDPADPGVDLPYPHTLADPGDTQPTIALHDTHVHDFSPVGTSVDEAYTLRDRKSTRLNSSHRTISYAVFCLKKKT